MNNSIEFIAVVYGIAAFITGAAAVLAVALFWRAGSWLIRLFI